MTKQTYMKPAMQVVKLHQWNIICGTTQGMNQTLQKTTVSSAWSRGCNDFDDEE